MEDRGLARATIGRRLSTVARHVYMASALVVGTIASVILALAVTLGRALRRRMALRARRH